MPEMRFQVEWPDGAQQTFYSPSLVMQDYLELGSAYDVDDFTSRCTTALGIGSDRVHAKYGYPCGRARAESERIRREASRFTEQPGAKVRVLKFIK